MLKMNLIANNLFDRESLTGSLMRHRYSAISGISSIKGSPKAIRGWLRQFHQDSPASPFQSPDSKKESKTKGISGLKRGIPLASFDPDTSSWRMSQVSLLPLNRLYTDCYGLDKYGGLRDLELSELPMPDEYNLTWPKWGMIVAGELYPLTTSVRRISEKGGGLWRTPSSQIIEAKSSVKKLSNRKPSDPQVGLADQVMYPTPAAAHAEQRQNEYDGKRGQTLLGAAKGQLWPTPNRPDGGRTIPEDADWKGRTVAYNKKGKKVQVGLESAVKKWPTPRQQDSYERRNWKTIKKINENGGDLTLPSKVKYQEGGGQLNPDWVEWLMGWPIGWTSIKPLKELIWLSWDIDPADMQEPIEWRTPAQQEPGIKTERLKPIEGGVLGGMNRHFDIHTGRQAEIGLTQQVQLRNQGIGIIPRVAVNIPNRVNRLKALGNGQVPLCTATAWELLNGH